MTPENQDTRQGIPGKTAVRICASCASPLEAGSGVCSRCAGLVPAASNPNRSRRVAKEPDEDEADRAIGWLQRPKVRELEKPSWRKRLVEGTALVVFTGTMIGGGILVFQLNVSKDGGTVSILTALALVPLCIVPALFFAMLAAIGVGATVVFLEEALLAPLLNRYSGNTMPSLPESVLAKTEALDSELSLPAEDQYIPEPSSPARQPDIQRLDGEPLP
jgi:hypothetical protein